MPTLISIIIMNEKKELRKQMYKTLKALNASQIQRQSNTVTQQVINHPLFNKSQRISVYLSTSTEIDTVPILEAIFNRSKQCFVPRFVPNSSKMQMVRIISMQDFYSLPSIMWNIKQPLLEDKREDALESGGLDLVITPGLAFTLKGDRLGHGRAYYDTFLTSHNKICQRKPYTIALALRQQICEHIPVTDNDITIDEVIFDNSFDSDTIA